MNFQSPLNRKLSIGALLVLYTFFGILKWRYLLNFWVFKGGFLLSRTEVADQLKYDPSTVDKVNYFLLNPKWLSIIIFSNIFLLLDMGLVYLIYNKSAYVKFTFWLYIAYSWVSLFILAGGFLTNTYQDIAPIVARLKEMQQSPLMLVFLLGAFKIYEMPLQSK
ncbi:MAG: hypothetical protein K2Q22_13360 [Cytophagales bacterium]|nr:hypothetical protein [Cytophagales bacterium]